MLKLIETYNEAPEGKIGQDIEVFKCTDCGRKHSVFAGGNIACCPCEFENEEVGGTVFPDLK